MEACKTEIVKLFDIADRLEERGVEEEAKELRDLAKSIKLEVTVVESTLKGIVNKIKVEK